MRLTLDVHSGEFLGFLGPNGAGKTTDDAHARRRCSPEPRRRAGVVGHDVVRERWRVRRQHRARLPGDDVDGLLTVEENLRFAGRLDGLGGSELRAAVDGGAGRSST